MSSLNYSLSIKYLRLQIHLRLKYMKCFLRSCCINKSDFSRSDSVQIYLFSNWIIWHWSISNAFCNIHKQSAYSTAVSRSLKQVRLHTYAWKSNLQYTAAFKKCRFSKTYYKLRYVSVINSAINNKAKKQQFAVFWLFSSDVLDLS